MSTFSLRIDDNLKERLQKIAEDRRLSLNALLVDYIQLGGTLANYVDGDSQVTIKDAKGFKGETVLLPVQQMLGN